MVDFFMSPQGRNGAGQNARIIAAKKVAEATERAKRQFAEIVEERAVLSHHYYK